MRRWGLVLALGAVAFAGKDLGQQAKAKMDEVEPLWKVYLTDADKLTDDDLARMIAHYDEAIDLLHELSEEKESAQTNSVILLLARRTAKLRAAVWGREMRRKAEEAHRRRETERREKKEPEADDAPPEQKPERTKPAEAKQQPAPPPRGPEIVETKKERALNIRRLRRFLSEHYRHLKSGGITVRCKTCGGRGEQILYRRTRRGRMVRTGERPCPKCAGRGGWLSEDKARRAWWLSVTPLTRGAEEFQAQYDEKIAKYKDKPAEFMTPSRLSIGKVEYFGLWATVSWKVKKNRQTQRHSRTFVRIGRKWFFYHHAFDASLLEHLQHRPPPPAPQGD